MIAITACIAYNICMQYTIRNIPKVLDTALRQRAQDENASLNEVVVRALTRALGFSDEPLRHRELDDLIGSWKEDPLFDQAVVDQDTVDEELWK